MKEVKDKYVRCILIFILFGIIYILVLRITPEYLIEMVKFIIGFVAGSSLTYNFIKD